LEKVSVFDDATRSGRDAGHSLAVIQHIKNDIQMTIGVSALKSEAKRALDGRRKFNPMGLALRQYGRGCGRLLPEIPKEDFLT
jgi:hypothetical protein